MFNNKTVLITGGTGTLGKALVERILKKYPKVKRLIIYSRDEQKQFLMEQVFSLKKYPSLRYFIGDVRDYDRLLMAFDDVDYVIHTAAMKHVPISEYNPDECIKTNIFGAQNVIKASLNTNVKNVIALSTDKACSPINLYGATKLTSDKLFITANNIKGKRNLKFSVVRYGNVLGSKGSVVPFFMNKRKEGILPITDENMTRFNITLSQGVNMVLYALINSWGGELFVPKIPSYKITDMANAISPKSKKKIVGIRPGEKLHEEMISETDSLYTYDIGKYYIILPSTPNWDIKEFILKNNAKKVKFGFKYNSGENSEWETVDSLRKLIKENFDSNFKVS
tara:strand:+ start:885 stop:1898 length:1014 start_codon:yes stop_codon:yes gene_type:complete